MHSSPRRRRADHPSAFLTMACLAMLGATGCGLALGLGDFEDQPEDGAGAAGASTSASGSPGGSGSNTGAAGGAGTTGGAGGAQASSSSTGVGGEVEECPGTTECVAPPPAGWSGPVSFYTGATPPDACPPAWPTAIEATAGNVTGTFSCGACSCGAVTGASCSVPNYTVWFDSGCGSQPNSFSLSQNGSCKNTNGGYGATVGTSTPSGGDCVSGGGGITKDPIVWENGALLCDGGAVATCPGGVCTPKPEAPFGESVCVYKDGEEPGCPLAYPNRTVVYRGETDTRQCSACGCGGATGVSCDAVVMGYSNSTCSGAGSFALTSDSCNTQEYWSSAKFVNAPQGGSCPPTGGAASGSVAPTLPLTVCCL